MLLDGCQSTSHLSYLRLGNCRPQSRALEPSDGRNVVNEASDANRSQRYQCRHDPNSRCRRRRRRRCDFTAVYDTRGRQTSRQRAAVSGRITEDIVAAGSTASSNVGRIEVVES